MKDSAWDKCDLKHEFVESSSEQDEFDVEHQRMMVMEDVQIITLKW